MRAQSALLTMFLLTAAACGRSQESTPPEPGRGAPDPSASHDGDEPEPEPAPEPEDDALDELDEAPAPAASTRPDPIEVEVDAVITDSKPEATTIMVGTDPRFTLNMKIERVEPATSLLEPGLYNVMIESPSHTFRGPVPGKGKRIRFRMSIFPEDPADPHDEDFFADLWIE